LRLETVLLAGILLLAAALRLYKLGEAEPWWDEFLSLYRAMMPTRELLHSLATQAATNASTDTSPPLHHLLIHASLLLGKSAWFGRLPSLVFGTASLYFTYLVGRDFLSRRTGLLASLYGTLLLFHIAYCRDMRWYGVFYAFAVASPWFLWRALGRGAMKDWAGFVLASTGMAYASYLAAPFLVGEGVWAALAGLAHWRRPETAAIGRRQLLGLALATLAVGLLYLPQVHGHLVAYETFHIPGVNISGPHALWEALCQFVADWSPLAPVFAGIVLVLAGIGLRSVWRSGRRFELSGLLAWGLTPTLVAFLVNVHAEVKPKYLVGLLFLVIFLAAAGADALATRICRHFSPRAVKGNAPLFLGLALIMALAWPNVDGYTAFFRGPQPLYKAWALHLARGQENTDLLLLDHNRPRQVILEWFLKSRYRFLGEHATRLYRRFVFASLKTPPAWAHAAETVSRGGETISFSRAGVASLAPIPVIPNPSGRFRYIEDPSSLSVFENAWELDNIAPDFTYGTLALHVQDRPGRLLYRFTATEGASLRGATIRLGLFLFDKIRGYQPDAKLRLAAGTAPEALTPIAEYDIKTFAAQDRRLADPAAAGNFEAEVTAPLPDLTGDSRNLYLSLEFVPGGYGADIELGSLEVTGQVPIGPAPDVAAIRLAHLQANTTVASWRPGISPLDGNTLFAFSVDLAAPVSPGIGSSRDLAAFQAANPGLPPVLTIPGIEGSPAYLAFDPLLLTSEIALGSSLMAFDNPGPAFTTRGLLLRGELDRPTLCLDGQNLSIPVAAPTGSTLRLNPGGEGLISFTPSYGHEAFTVTNMIQHDPVRPTAQSGAITCASPGPCSFTYLFASDLPITGFRLLTYPSVANDGRQRVRASYRLDNFETSRTIFEYCGGGYTPWTGIHEGLDSQVRLPRPARLLFVRFDLSGDGAQLNATNDEPMRLEVRLDATGLSPLAVPNGTFSLGHAPGHVGPLLVWLSPQPLGFFEDWVR
jgi:hypothetical protein